MTTKILPQTRRQDLVTQELKDELLIYDLKLKKFFCLNKTSALVWELCDGSNSIADITRLINREFKETVSEEFVWLAIDGLKKENLLENSFAMETKFAGFSRREAIRRAGLATMIALPVISSFIAPTSAMAQSAAGTTALGQSCNSSTECVSSAPYCAPIYMGGQACCATRGLGLGAFQSGQHYAYPGPSQSFCDQRGDSCCSGSSTVNSIDMECVCN